VVEYYGMEVAVGAFHQAEVSNQVGGMFACQLVDSKACRSLPFGVGSGCCAFSDCGCEVASLCGSSWLRWWRLGCMDLRTVASISTASV
jgi:hypothetical protein